MPQGVDWLWILRDVAIYLISVFGILVSIYFLIKKKQETSSKKKRMLIKILLIAFVLPLRVMLTFLIRCYLRILPFHNSQIIKIYPDI